MIFAPKSCKISHVIFTSLILGKLLIVYIPFNNNVAILNNYTAEEIQALLLQCGTIISQTNTRQMAQIGFPETFINPIVASYAMPFN